MGLALAQSLEQREHGYESGFLRDTFSQGGVSEVTTAEILSIEKFLRAEESLGHIPPESIHDLNNMHVEHTDDVTHYLFEKKLRGYNEDDIMSEQSGDLHKSDGDVVTAGGYMKTTVSTIGHEKNKEERHRRQMQMHLFALEQNERLSELMAEIEALKDQLKEIDAKIAETDEIQTLLADGDLNDTTDIAAARRKRVESLLKKQGKSLDDYKRADGSIDQERLRRDMADQRSDLDRQKIETQEQLDRKNQELQDLERGNLEQTRLAAEQGDTAKLQELADGATGGRLLAHQALAETNPSLVNEAAFDASAFQNMQVTTVTAGAVASNDESMGLDDLAGFDLSEPAYDDNQLSALDALGDSDFSFSEDNNTVAFAAAPNTVDATGERSYGSFAANADEQSTSVITSMFAQVSDPAATPQVTQPATTLQQDVQNTAQIVPMGLNS